MNPLDLPARVVLPASASATSRPASSQGRAFTDALKDVAGIARDIATERVGLASQMRRIVASGDNRQMPQVYSRILDANARQDVLATVLTKTTTGIDQIVKMQ
ncbi:hypothetical protein SAMN05216359_10240 [Roseateles sp. YR242]|uniref:hypothetical protein n=1 Tax=Roseateles sp. YR242 TaxID=1855305 RepID=UPI0008C6D491|nr:hypothetical protein [Roseateles sp. YR242]SEK51293.1 hypothetical protein SAMN05216359_10240 [Roseateles sp. YR242]